MKKLILAVLMVVMIVTPCLAQEVEPDGIFSIEGTEWQSLPIRVQIFPFPLIEFVDHPKFGFYDGEVYEESAGYWSVLSGYDYMDMLGFSIFGDSFSISTNQVVGDLTISYFGILQPTGIGIVVTVFECSLCGALLPSITITLLIKTDDNWKPPEVE